MMGAMYVSGHVRRLDVPGAVPVNEFIHVPNEITVNMPSRWDGVCLFIIFYKHAVPTGQRCTVVPAGQRAFICPIGTICL